MLPDPDTPVGRSPVQCSSSVSSSTVQLAARWSTGVHISRATSTAVRPQLSAAYGLAPALSSTSTQRLCPAAAAKWSGVSPQTFFVSVPANTVSVPAVSASSPAGGLAGSHTPESSCLRASTLSDTAAWWRQPNPLSFAAAVLHLASASNAVIIVTSLKYDAHSNGVFPLPPRT